MAIHFFVNFDIVPSPSRFKIRHPLTPPTLPPGKLRSGNEAAKLLAQKPAIPKQMSALGLLWAVRANWFKVFDRKRVQNTTIKVVLQPK